MPQSQNKYTYRVTWSEEDQEYLGLCAEFNSLSWLAKSPELALKGIQQVVVRVLKDLKKNKEIIPIPLSEKHFSGKFMVRVPSEVHRKLSVQATEASVSLNRYVSSRLA